jgi:hypothetical protein
MKNWVPVGDPNPQEIVLLMNFLVTGMEMLKSSNPFAQSRT